MAELYWDQFKTTGKIDDYLSYREKEACKAIADDYGARSSAETEENNRASDNYSNRNDS